jgi:branched-chain amino acid aminotransferase
MNFSLAELEAADVDPESYAVLLDLDGNITENTAASLFIVSEGVLRTSNDHSTLQSVTRSTVLELSKNLGIPTVVEDIQPYDAYNADEAFLSTTSYCALPVSLIDKRPVNMGVPGPITKRILKGWSELVGMDIVEQALRYGRNI